MVERRLLTPDFVHSAIPPSHGERWVADTKIGGFGLRLWAGKTGGNKAFCLRVVNSQGRSVRQTFDTQKAWRTQFSFTYGGKQNSHGLGDYLGEARDWARDQVDGLKRRLTVDQEHRVAGILAGHRVEKMTLGKAAQSMIAGMRFNGRSQAYIDRIDKLFANNISTKLKRRRLHSLRANELARSLVKTKTPAGNIRILRSFIGQILEQASSFGAGLDLLSKELATEFSERWEKVRDVRYPELRKLGEEDYQTIFRRLEEEHIHWQSALCIRLFFEFHAPLSRVCAGQWAQIVDDCWYPYWPHEKVLWFECEERIDENSRRLLQLIRKNVRRDFGVSKYWFPTKAKGGVSHIQNVGPTWRTTLKRCRLPQYPLREFARSYRNPHCPSYLVSFLRQYGKTFREVRNAAELSKRLLERYKTAEDSAVKP
jgi:hypothetical protein